MLLRMSDLTKPYTEIAGLDSLAPFFPHKQKTRQGKRVLVGGVMEKFLG